MKKPVLSALRVCLALAVLCAALGVLAGCSKGPYDGTYYFYDIYYGGVIDRKQYIEIRGDKWTVMSGDDPVDGICVIDGETGALALKYRVGSHPRMDAALFRFGAQEGDEVDLYAGEIAGGVIKVRFMKESQTLTFYLDGKIPAGN